MMSYQRKNVIVGSSGKQANAKYGIVPQIKGSVRIIGNQLMQFRFVHIGNGDLLKIQVNIFANFLSDAGEVGVGLVCNLREVIFD